MKNKNRKALRVKLLAALKRVLKTNKAALKTKAEKSVLKSIKKIVDKTKTDNHIVSTKKNKEAGLRSGKVAIKSIPYVSRGKKKIIK